VNGLIDLLDERTPIYPPLGRLIVVAGLFLVAWLVTRLAGRLAAFLVDRSVRRSGLEGSTVDTGVITGLKQRETAISLVQTSIAYLVFGIALLLSLMAWHSAHHLRHFVLDIGLKRFEMPLASALYGLAALTTLASLIAVVRLLR